MQKKCLRCEQTRDCGDFHARGGGSTKTSAICKACACEKARLWYEKNKERHKTNCASYAKANPEKIKAIKTKSAAKCLDRAVAYSKTEHFRKLSRLRKARWEKKNMPACAAKTRRYRARKVKADGDHSWKDVLHIIQMQKGRCAVCNIDCRDDYHVDHIVPLFLGGSNKRSNLQVLCPFCNVSKGAKPPHKFMREKGFLI